MKDDPRSCERNLCNCVKKPEKNSGLQRRLNFFLASLHNCMIAFTTARIILHLISFPQFIYDLFHIHHSHFDFRFSWMLLKAGTRNGERGTANGEPGTGNQEPGTGNQEREAGNEFSTVIRIKIQQGRT